MFPIVHYFVNMETYGQVPPLMALGGLFPDLAAGTGMDRNDAHQMGAAFYHWCESEAAWALPLARGIISHGILPLGVDYYADEAWPGCERGWCFEEGQPWIERIAEVTHLPERLLWWKSHNFVEMSCELLTIEQHPGIGQAIMDAVRDDELVEQAAAILHQYTGREQALISAMFRRAPETFALEDITPQALAERQDIAYRRRHNIYDADVPGIAALLAEMSEALAESYAYYMPQANKLVKDMLANY